MLEVTMVSASKLQNVAMLGKMDPYCVVFFLNEKTRTKTVKNGGSNPVWNESFKCKTSDDVDQTIKIMIKNEKESREYSSALRISIERKYRRQRGKRGERKNG